MSQPQRDKNIHKRTLSGTITHKRADGENAETDAHLYEIKASSEQSVEIWHGIHEILDHNPESIRLDWLSSGNAPLLNMHDKHQQVGVIENARIENKSIIISARISPNQKDLITDIEAGIIKNVSIGYRIYNEKIESTESNEQGEVIKKTWRVTDWKPKEVSIVSIPADDTVGFMRQYNQDEVRHVFLEAKTKLTPTPQNTVSTKTTTTPPVKTAEEIRSEKKDAVKNERERIAKIHHIATRSQQDGLGDHQEKAQEFIEQGRSVAEFQEHILDNIQATPPVSQRDLNLTEKESGQYNLNNVIRGLQTNDFRGCENELEISDEIKKRTGKDNDRIAIPLDVLMRGYQPTSRQRDLVSVSLNGAGQTDTAGNIVDNQLLDSMFIDSLRENSPLLGLGVNIITGLKGDVTIPKELVNPEFYWIGEDDEPTEGSYGLGNITLNFKTLAAQIPFTRQALKQSTPNLENLLTRSLRIGQAIALEKALINGTGGSQPTGILQTAGIGAVSATTLTYSALLELEEALGTANADTSQARLFTNTRGKRRLLETEKAPNTAKFLATREGNSINTDIGQVICSNNVPNDLGATTDRSAIIYGVFRSLMVAMWGNLEIARDTSTKAATGGVVLRVFSDVDAQVSRAEEFAAITNLS